MIGDKTYTIIYEDGTPTEERAFSNMRNLRHYLQEKGYLMVFKVRLYPCKYFLRCLSRCIPLSNS